MRGCMNAALEAMQARVVAGASPSLTLAWSIGPLRMQNCILSIPGEMLLGAYSSGLMERSGLSSARLPESGGNPASSLISVVGSESGGAQIARAVPRDRRHDLLDAVGVGRPILRAGDQTFLVANSKPRGVDMA